MAELPHNTEFFKSWIQGFDSDLRRTSPPLPEMYVAREEMADMFDDFTQGRIQDPRELCVRSIATYQSYKDLQGTGIGYRLAELPHQLGEVFGLPADKIDEMWRSQSSQNKSLED